MKIKHSSDQDRRPDIGDEKARFKAGERSNEPKELGFGTNIVEEVRLINKDGSYNVKRSGRQQFHPYYSLTSMSWPKFNLLVLASFIIVNTFFAFLYMLIGFEQLASLEPQGSFLKNFLESFYFSCQTFTSVGYGRINPIGLLSGMVSSIEALVGLLALALATGLLFARFSRPEAKLLFSKNVLISPFKGGKALMFKFANPRKNQLIEVEVQVSLAVLVQENGVNMRRFYNLNLERGKVNFFPLTWTIVHPINDDSPIKNIKSINDFRKLSPEILVSVKAFDDAFSQTVYCRYSYITDDVIWGAKFKTNFHSENGTVILELDNIDDFEMAGLPIEDTSLQINAIG